MDKNYDFKILDETDYYVEDGKINFREKSFNEFKEDVKNWLIKSDWHYSLESAQQLVDKDESYIKDAFLKGESSEEVGIDIGYCCG